jgi:superfamily II DNA or RNA helicase
MKVLISVGPQRLKLSPRLSGIDIKKIRKVFTFTMPGYEYTKKHKLHNWDGSICYFRTQDQSAPAGSLARVRTILKTLGYRTQVKYENNYKPEGDINIHGFELKDFQKKAVERAEKFRYGIISAPVRAGKTAISAALVKRIGHFPAWIITNGKDLVRQTQEDLEYHLQRPIGYLSEGMYVPGDIVVTSYQAITRALTGYHGGLRIVDNDKKKRNTDVFNTIAISKVLILDECHHAIKGKFSKLRTYFPKAGYILGLSGTPRPSNTHKLEVENAIGSVIYKVDLRTLVEDGRLAQPKVVTYRLPLTWFITTAPRAPTALERFKFIYKANIVENIQRNKFIAEIVRKLNSKGKTAFVMIAHIAHGPILRALIPNSVIVKGSVDSTRRKELYQALQTNRITCIIGTVGKEGLNIPRLNAVVNAEGYQSKVATVQKLRSLTATKDKKYGLIIDFIDRGRYLTKHSHARTVIYENLIKKKITPIPVPRNYRPLET